MSDEKTDGKETIQGETQEIEDGDLVTVYVSEDDENGRPKVTARRWSRNKQLINWKLEVTTLEEMLCNRRANTNAPRHK